MGTVVVIYNEEAKKVKNKMDSKEAMERIKFEVSQEMGLSKPVEKKQKNIKK